ncbi:MAG: hypothetical protein ACOYYU_02505 [Chloroflexota bacterium]
MSRLDTVQTPVTFSLAPFPGTEPARRLIVLIPNAETDYTAVVSRVWELANALGSRVQFLGLCRDAAEEPSLRRQLVTISALAQNGNIPSEVRIETGTDWVTAIEADLKSGDTIVCFSEQRVGRSRKLWSHILESNLEAPVYVLSGLLAQERPDSSRLKGALAWSGSLGITLGFFLLQIRIQPATGDWAHTSLLLFSLVLEVSLLLLWNSLFG